ncbi:type II secretion system protein [Pseudoduganella namucuonensis]|uniref:Prepilin-type N-terminal cleavage/methylation domain-containing protein n=1 Tax=Pseudoduganella namucuonensis TaxID=1035707 RepID=A0A1I7L6A2_9BURK|nr:type II secretion system protein [Pseudoduganella namucuonensis]SFV05168.1 prepilin-type N-terminal cleavage/methylation domain-containing protein [Pseudoduganella namucuonensis]
MKPSAQKGFSLVEIAIVLVIVGLMIGGLLTPLTMQIEQRKIADTQRALEEARDALVGYALRYGHLPCPAISATDGQEDRNGARCTDERRDGFLPWATLGLPKLDSWQHLYRYSVTPAFTDSANRFKLVTPRDISVHTRDATGQATPATAASDIPAVILSHGKNGYGASSELGIPVAGAPRGNADEQGNAVSDVDFMARGASDGRAPGGEYDDLVVWVSPNILFNRMVAAQVLP